jgi:hypothetical protein
VASYHCAAGIRSVTSISTSQLDQGTFGIVGASCTDVCGEGIGWFVYVWQRAVRAAWSYAAGFTLIAIDALMRPPALVLRTRSTFGLSFHFDLSSCFTALPDMVLSACP